jgi:hypothetical protein
MTPEQLLREPGSSRSGARSDSPRSLSNEALLASLRPPADHGSSHALRRSMEPHLVDGVSWFLDRTSWQRVLLSTGLGALVGIGIVVTLARLFVPDLGTTAASAAPAASSLAALAAPAAATLREPPAAPAITAVAPPPPAPAEASALPQPSAAAPADVVASLNQPAEAAPAKGKAVRKAKAAKRSKKARQQRARKTSSLPARWAELYARDR